MAMLVVAALAAGLTVTGPVAADPGPPPGAAHLPGPFIDPPSADPWQVIERDLNAARLTHAQAVAALRVVEQRFTALDTRYRAVLGALDRTTREVVRSELEQRAVSEQLDTAQSSLNQRAAAAYMAGPGASWEIFLGADTPSGYLSAQEYAAHTFVVDQRTIDQVSESRASLEGVTRRLLRRQVQLRATIGALESLDATMADGLALAERVARRAGLAVDRIESKKHALERARAEAERAIHILIDPTKGVDQTALLARLGPTDGRGCRIPPSLREAGVRLTGLASLYGWDLAGSHTSTGAIFDPRLFTAANKVLPLNTYLRVRFGDRCAIVLVNDHGPYGLGRSFDLSLAAARYLGYESPGVVTVTADVLLPAE
jgi:hypothetical protein